MYRVSCEKKRKKEKNNKKSVNYAFYNFKCIHTLSVYTRRILHLEGFSRGVYPSGVYTRLGGVNVGFS